MTSTTTRYPVKAKSLTLLELCQTISDLRHTYSRNTAQILTRRLYLHPLTVNTNAKQQSSKINRNNLLEIEQLNQRIPESRPSPRKRQPYRDLSILSSSFPLTTRFNPKLHTSLHSHHENSTEFEESTNTFATYPVSLPAIRRNPTSSSKRTVTTRSSFISIQQKPKSNPPESRAEPIDVWRQLAQSLQRPVPKDPPTTPLDILSDSLLANSVEQMHIFKRQPPSESSIEDDD